MIARLPFFRFDFLTMKTPYLLPACVFCMVMSASSDNLYWNPTTSKKGAGSGVWGDCFTLHFTGTPEEGMIVASGSSNESMTVTGLPARYKLQHGFRGAGLYSLERPYTLLMLR